ncbi:MAG: hypothetical protein ACP5O1_01145 [Phycisphaerae bacterium]
MQHFTFTQSSESRATHGRLLTAGAFGAGIIFPVAPALLIAYRSSDGWVRQQATVAAGYQAMVAVAAVAGAAALRVGVSVAVFHRLVRHPGLQTLLSQTLAAGARSPLGLTLILTGGLLIGLSVVGWWAGNILAAVGALRGDSLGWPRVKRRRRRAA